MPDARNQVWDYFTFLPLYGTVVYHITWMGIQRFDAL